MAPSAASKFNILQQSPYDTDRAVSGTGGAELPATASRWTPSRYTVRSATTQGSLVLWNTFSNRMSVFTPELAPRVIEILGQRRVEGPCEGLVRFLADRGFLVSEDSDELQRFRYAFGKEHYANDRLQLFLLASEDCNFRCKYCYERFTRGTMARWVRTGVKRYLAERLPRLKRLNLEWFGGEPLYGMEAIEDIAPVALELAERHSVAYSSRMSTNGYLLTPEVADRLFAWKVSYYQVTIDGPAEHHDRMRPARDGSATFATILENLKALQRRREDFHVMLRVNFDRSNASDLDRLLDVVERELEADQRFRLAFRSVDRWGAPADDEADVCTRDEAEAVQHRMKAEARKRGLLLAGGIFQAGGLGAQVCYAARPYSFVIGATGKIMKCTIDLDRCDRNVVGSIDEDGNLTLDADKMARWTEPAFEEDAKCRKCVLLPACQGMSCPPTRWDTNSSPCVPVRATYKRDLRVAAGDVTE